MQTDNDPGLRPITPDDLNPWPHAGSTPPPAAPISATPAGWTASSPSSRPSPASVNCEQCGDVGYYLLRVRGDHAQFGKLQKCTCAAYHRQIAAVTQRLGDELGALSDRTFARFNLDRPLSPIAWQGKPIGVKAQRTAMEQALERCQAWAETPRGWLYIHGAFGAGKSHLAASIANARIGRGITRFLPVGKLLDTLTMTVRDGTTDRLLADLLDCELLILDELSTAHLAEAASDWRFGRLERIINERLSKPTVITSNVAPDDLALPGDIRAERVADRIVGVSQIVWLPVASYRRIEAAS